MDTLSFFDIPRLRLIDSPTPVHAFKGVHELLGHRKLFIKREDATHSVYGGNKVRNLEFILADAIKRKSSQVVTLAPVGSNFVAALAVQTRLLNLPLKVFQFRPARTPLIDAQARFTRDQGAEQSLFGEGRYVSAIRAQLALAAEGLLAKNSYIIAPGGSSILGVLGHMSAVFELAEQVRQGEVPEPAIILVGVGTCGTMAGLLAGLRLSGLKSKVIGVRCVDRLICNRLRVATLANAALKKLHSSARVRLSDVDIRHVEEQSYGEPLNGAEQTILDVKQLSGVELDTTYTTKVFSFLRTLIAHGDYADQNILYWNTFSPRGFPQNTQL